MAGGYVVFKYWIRDNARSPLQFFNLLLPLACFINFNLFAINYFVVICGCHQLHSLSLRNNKMTIS